MGRIAKWGTIIGAFDIKCLPQMAIKGQVLADIVAKFTECLGGAVTKEAKLVGV